MVESASTAPLQRLVASPSEVVLGLAETNPRSLGGPMGLLLANLLIKEERKVEAMQVDINRKSGEIQRIQGELHLEQTNVAVLNEKLKALTEKLHDALGERVFRGAGGVFGTWLTGFAMDNLKTGAPSGGYYVVAAGGVLMVIYSVFGKGWKRGAKP